MTIEKIKNNIDSKKGNNVKVIYNGSRNKKEEYEGIIKEVYNYIFIIIINNKTKKPRIKKVLKIKQPKNEGKRKITTDA